MVRIATDSSPLYTPEEGKALGFDVVPLSVSVGDLHDRDLLVDMDEFYGRIAKGQIPQSSQPPIGEVAELYEAYPEDEIINIAMADGLSGTYQSACSAVTMVENPQRISVFNSLTLCGPHRYMVEKAQHMAESGATREEILAWLEEASKKHESYLIPQDFAFLRRGGRLTPMAAALGSALKLKPIMTQTADGKRLKTCAVKRTFTAAVAAVLERAKAFGLCEKHILYISHARAPKDAEKAREMFAKEFPGLEIQMLDLGAAFVTQGGPLCVALQYIEK